jgi:hypothetical protein
MNWEEYWRLSEEVRTERITADANGLVFHGKGYVFEVIISSDGGGEADADLYDGIDASGTQKLDLYCADEESYQYHFDPPMCLTKGCFIDVGTNVGSVVVRYAQ